MLKSKMVSSGNYTTSFECTYNLKEATRGAVAGDFVTHTCTASISKGVRDYDNSVYWTYTLVFTNDAGVECYTIECDDPYDTKKGVMMYLTHLANTEVTFYL